MINFINFEDTYESIQKTKLTKLKDDFLKEAIRYAHIRAEWQYMSFEEKNENEADRTAAHNAFIDSCNTDWKNNIVQTSHTRLYYLF